MNKFNLDINWRLAFFEILLDSLDEFIKVDNKNFNIPYYK
jgi:hypothetical protein